MALRLASRVARPAACTTSRRSRSPSWWRRARRAADSVAELAAEVDVLCVMVRDDDQVRERARRGARHGRRRPGRGRALDGRARHAAQLEVTAAATASGSSTRRSAAARWARPTARWRSWSAATEAAYAAARPVLERMGSQGRARRPDRRRHADEAGPQPDALRRVHRGHRGAAAGRGGRARPGRARRGRPAHRRDHRRTRRDHAPRHHGAAGRRTTSGSASSTTSGRWGRRTSAFAIELADTLGVDVPLAQLARESGSAKGLGLPDRGMRTDRQVRRPPRAAPPRPGEDGAGLRLRDDRRRGRLLPLHRRPPLRRHLEPARPHRPRPPAAADRDAGRAPAAHDVLGIQVPAAHANGELDDEALREIVIFLCHYAGWPNGARLNSIVEDTIAKAPSDAGPSPDHVRGRCPAGEPGLLSARPGPDLAAARLYRDRVRRRAARPSSYAGDLPATGARARRLARPTRRPVRRSGGRVGRCLQRHRGRRVAQRQQRGGRRAGLDLPGRRARPPRPRLGRGVRAARRGRGRRPRWSGWPVSTPPGIKARRALRRARHTRATPTAIGIFASVAAALDDGPLADLVVDIRLAIGESQSAYALTTFVNGVHPLDRSFDGFLIHSRGGAADAARRARA